MVGGSRFVGEIADLTITPGPPFPPEMRVRTSGLGLREIRLAAGLSLDDAAGSSGLRRAEIASLEYSEDARISVLVRYLEALGGGIEIVVGGRRALLERAD